MTLTQEDALRLEECLAGDGVAVIPTDTVYGLACNPDSKRAVRRLYELKGRPSFKPAAVMFFALDPALRALPELGKRTHAAMRALLPGPVTLLLANPCRRFPLACLPALRGVGPSGRDPSGARPDVLGVRVPSFDGPLAALSDVSISALQSSANLSGNSAPRRFEDVPALLRAAADLALDGGELPGAASTVIDLSDYEHSGSWRIVRDGPLQRALLERLLR